MREVELKMLRAISRVLAVLVAVVAGPGPALSAQDDLIEVIVPKPGGPKDTRHIYTESLLSLALEKAGRKARLVQTKEDYSRDRLLQELVRGRDIHLAAEAPKADWEQQLLPIHIPIRKGIQGYRLFLINKQDQAAIANVRTLADFQRFPTGAGTQWSVRPLLEGAGFEVVTTENYQNLFEMLRLRRFITFGRGLNEIYSEQAKFGTVNENLIMEQTLCLFIPLPTYFFVSPAHPELARDIENGLKRMIADGSFDRHFMEFYAGSIRRAHLDRRKILTIANPTLSKQTPFDEPSYWYDPELMQRYTAKGH
ncbi:hypothetical protein FMN50_19295 [Rhodobacterales bacterium]|nr:hypothetical protein FMN50_19295 [Rhodobacterales bacterium]